MNWHWTSIDSIDALLQTPKQENMHASIYHNAPTELDDLEDPCEQSSPFLNAAFLSALENTHCVGGNSGWLPKHITIRDQTQKLIAFLPAYIKTHSYGEYVFDHSWAHAYEQHGLEYYPKLIIAVPFTPVTGSRILLHPSVNFAQVVEYIGNIKEDIMAHLSVSSLHFLFSYKRVSDALRNEGFHQRLSVQFNWHNKSYTSFDDFMAQLTARRRRSIRKERAGIAKQEVVVKRVAGKNIDHNDMAFFYKCYKQTYLKRSGHSGYLTSAFFQTLLTNMSDNLLLVLAEQHTPDGAKPIAAALFLHDKNGLYGRYWGALHEVSGLHFEACYYQGIEFCIEHKIPLFNPGTQGEHKILRGFAPTLCYSNHKMREEAFDKAVDDFLQRETPHIIDYAEKSASLLPFKGIEPEN
jgi:predicted N-acyltransferase